MIVLPSAVRIVIASAVMESTVPSIVGAAPRPTRPKPLPFPLPGPPWTSLGSKLAFGPPLVKKRPPPGTSIAVCEDAAAGAVVRPTANATPAVATSTATPSATLRIETPPLRGLTGAGASAGATAGPAVTVAAGTGLGAGSKAGTAGTGSVGDASADGFVGSTGVVTAGSPTRSAAR